MRRTQQVRRVLQRPSKHVVRLVLVNVERRRPDPALLQGRGEGIVINQAAPRSVDQEGSRPHLLDGELVDEVVVVLVERTVQGDAVRLEQEVLEGVDAGQA